MRNILLLLLLFIFSSLGLIGTVSAVGGYKCSPNEAYQFTDDGILIKNKDFPASHVGRGYLVIRAAIGLACTEVNVLASNNSTQKT